MSRFHLRALFLISLLSLLLIQCSIEKPVAPSWNLNLSLPLMNKYYDMAALIDEIDEDYLKVDSLGNPLFYFEEELDTINLTDRLRCDGTSTSLNQTLGVIDIRTAESREIVIHITDFYDGPAGYVPPCSATVRQNFGQFSDFSTVTVETAFATLTATNNLGLDLNIVRMKIFDRNLGDTLYTLILQNGIDDGESTCQSIIIENATFSNLLGFEVTGASLGGELESLEGKSLLVNFSLDSMRVIQGEAKIPSFELTDEQTITLPTTSIIDSARIKSGSLMVNLKNFTNLGADVLIDFPELKKDGKTLSTTCNLPASGSSDLNLALDGYTLYPDGGSQTKIQTRVVTPGSGEDLVGFQFSDSVTVETSLSETFFTQVAGILEPTRVAIDPIERVLDIPQGFESAQLVNASLNLEIHNRVDLPANLWVDIQGESGQNLSLEAEVEAGGPFGTAITTIYEEDLESFLSPVPQMITVTGEMICGDGQAFGIAKEDDFFFGIVKVSSPLELIWDSCQIETDESSQEADDDVKEIIEDQLNSGKVILKVENHLPVGAEIKVLFSHNQADLLSNPDLEIGPISISAGWLRLDGSVLRSRFSETEINVSYDDLQVFTGTPFHMIGIIDFPGTDGRMVRASAADFIKLTSYLELNMKNKKD